jgi:hypothetical protein
MSQLDPKRRRLDALAAKAREPKPRLDPPFPYGAIRFDPEAFRVHLDPPTADSPPSALPG